MNTTPHTPASLRVRLGLTQEQLAASAEGVSTSTVRRLERGLSVNVDHLLPLAAALHVTSEELIVAMLHERERRKASRARPARARRVTKESA